MRNTKDRTDSSNLSLTFPLPVCLSVCLSLCLTPTHLHPAVPVKHATFYHTPGRALSLRGRTPVPPFLWNIRTSCHQALDRFRRISPWSKHLSPRATTPPSHALRPCPCVSPSPVDLLSLPAQLVMGPAWAQPAGQSPKQVAYGPLSALGAVPPALRPLQKESPLISQKMYIPTPAPQDPPLLRASNANGLHAQIGRQPRVSL